MKTPHTPASGVFFFHQQFVLSSLYIIGEKKSTKEMLLWWMN
jgi:hypothetical protein